MGSLSTKQNIARDSSRNSEWRTPKHLATPMSIGCYLDKDESGQPVDEKQYRGMIGSLLYLFASRPDIMFSVCMCARFQSNPKFSHLTTVKRIIRYLLGTVNLGLWYPKNFVRN